MKHPRLYPSFLIAAAVTVLLISAARADEAETASIKFSDPSKPGILKVSIANGDVHVKGTDAPDVTVQTDLKAETKEVRKDGLRVLTSASSYSLTEHNNTVVLTHGTDNWMGNGGDFNITVPHNTTVIISSNFGGDIVIGGITGNLEVKTLNGEVVLQDIAGAALVETMNGEIKATVSTLVDNKPLSFTSMNGEVTLNLPASAKANVRLRSHNGAILTDFDDKVLVTKTETVRVGGHSRRGPVVINGVVASDVAAAAHEAARAGAEAAREAAVAVRNAANAARAAARDAERQAARSQRDRDDDDDTPVAAIAPIAPLPPMTGGQVVTGTLNGGGTEIRIATMNGDVTLRKVESK